VVAYETSPDRIKRWLTLGWCVCVCVCVCVFVFVQSVRCMALGDSRGSAGRRQLTTSALAVEDDVELNAADSWDEGDDEVIQAQHDATGSDEFSVRAPCLPSHHRLASPPLWSGTSQLHTLDRYDMTRA
jgi:hypothetical protein